MLEDLDGQCIFLVVVQEQKIQTSNRILRQFILKVKMDSQENYHLSSTHYHLIIYLRKNQSR